MSQCSLAVVMPVYFVRMNCFYNKFVPNSGLNFKDTHAYIYMMHCVTLIGHYLNFISDKVDGYDLTAEEGAINSACDTQQGIVKCAVIICHHVGLIIGKALLQLTVRHN